MITVRAVASILLAGLTIQEKSSLEKNTPRYRHSKQRQQQIQKTLMEGNFHGKPQQGHNLFCNQQYLLLVATTARAQRGGASMKCAAY